MFFRGHFLNLKDDKQRRLKKWREKVKTKPLIWDLTSEGKSRRWSHCREEVKEGKKMLSLAVITGSGTGGEVRSCWEVELTSYWPPPVSKGSCCHFRIHITWLHFCRREQVGCRVLQMLVLVGITGKQSSDKMTGIAEAFGGSAGSSLFTWAMLREEVVIVTWAEASKRKVLLQRTHREEVTTKCLEVERRRRMFLWLQLLLNIVYLFYQVAWGRETTLKLLNSCSLI